MTTNGSSTTALLHLRQELSGILNPLGWKLLTADNPFQKFNAMAATPGGGICVISWTGDKPMGQAGRSLVVRASFTVTLLARADAHNPATAKLSGTEPRLFEIHDRVKGFILTISMPPEIVPEPGAEVLLYNGSTPPVAPNGVPLDAIEQRWEVELCESFDPEHATQTP